MRLIDADEFIKEINNRCESAIKWGINAIADHNEEIIIRAEQAIATFCEASLTAKKMPTIDAVEVVRCMDCRYFQCNMRQDGSLPFGVDEYECRHWCGYCDPMNFCSYGERREEK